MKELISAKVQIEQILKNLESETGMVVSGISVESIDASTIDEPRSRLIRFVNIGLYRPADSEWSSGK